MIVSTDVEKSDNPFTRPVKRVTPSGGNAQGELLEFFIDIDTDVLEYSDLEALEVLFDDLEWLHRRELNEALHFAKKSSTGARSIARKWYSANRGRVAKLQMRLKRSKGLQKKKEIRAKSGVNLKKKKKKKYHTKSHVSEAINRNIEKGAEQIVDKMFENTPYRIIRSFSIDGNIEANLNEKIEHVCGGTWILTKRNGKRYKLSVTDNEYITPFIKNEKDITVEDFL